MKNSAGRRFGFRARMRGTSSLRVKRTGAFGNAIEGIRIGEPWCSALAVDGRVRLQARPSPLSQLLDREAVPDHHRRLWLAIRAVHQVARDLDHARRGEGERACARITLRFIFRTQRAGLETNYPTLPGDPYCSPPIARRHRSTSAPSARKWHALGRIGQSAPILGILSRCHDTLWPTPRRKPQIGRRPRGHNARTEASVLIKSPQNL